MSDAATATPSPEMPELSIEHINAAGLLMQVAAKAGVFQLPQFAQVFAAFSECVRVVQASQKEESVAISDVDVNKLMLIYSVLEFAANNNAYKIEDYDAVVKVVAILGTHLKPHIDEAKAKKAAAEEKSKSEGVEESKE